MSLQTATATELSSSRYTDFQYMQLTGTWPTTTERALDAMLDKLRSDHAGYIRAFQDFVARNGRMEVPEDILRGVMHVRKLHEAAEVERLKRLQQQ